MKAFNRRAFLRGAGQSMIALPLSHFAWDGDRLIAAPDSLAPVRLFTMPWPAGAPTSRMTYTDFLKPLAGLQSQVAWIRNMSNPGLAEGLKVNGHHPAGAVAAFTGGNLGSLTNNEQLKFKGTRQKFHTYNELQTLPKIY